jgi:7,8-dihydroneopterin aldolase/epimerase/oxygenase
MKSQLIIEKLNLHVKLGHTPEERQLPQKVCVRIKLAFDRLPNACINDKLAHTLCYASLAKDLQQFCDRQSFKLIEALTYQLYQFLKIKLIEKLNAKVSIFLSVTKNPPLTSLEQATFLMSE